LVPEQRLLDSHLYSDSVLHPEFGRGELRELIFQGYDYIYETIGPAAYRIMKTWYEGSRTLRGSARPRLRARGELLARRAAALRPLFLATAEYLPNDAIRAEVQACLDEMAADLGPPDAEASATAAIFRGAFDAERRRLETEGPHVYEPSTRRTRYVGSGTADSEPLPMLRPGVLRPSFDVDVQRLRRA
jgi:hypothetical protein